MALYQQSCCICVSVWGIAVFCVTCSIEKVRQYMQEFFDSAQLLLATDKMDQSLIVELCLLCVHCLEVWCCYTYIPCYLSPDVFYWQFECFMVCNVYIKISCTDSLIHAIDSLIHSLIHSWLTHWFTLLIHSFTHWFIHDWLIDSFMIHSLIHSLIHSWLTHWFTPLIRWFTTWFIHSLTHWFMPFQNPCKCT